MTRALTPEPWVDEAVCASIGGDDWFPEQPGKQPAIKAICGSCPVATQCLQHAIDNDIRWGIWGGLGPKARRRLVNAA